MARPVQTYRQGTKAGRPRRPIVITSVNKPDAMLVASAAIPLVMDFIRRDREKQARKDEDPR